jgi:hypothetical protein
VIKVFPTTNRAFGLQWCKFRQDFVVNLPYGDLTRRLLVVAPPEGEAQAFD